MTKGISPLIATVIMVAFIISLGWIASQFIMGYTEKTKSGIETGGIVDYSGARLEIESDKVSIGQTIKIPVSNVGDKDLDNLRVIVYNESGAFTFTPNPDSIEIGYTKSLEVDCIPGNITKIEVTSSRTPGKKYEYKITGGIIRKVLISDCAELNQSGVSYYLTSDITDSSTSNCINITANDITFDCQGHTIDGDDTADTGIRIYKASGTTVKNCTLTDWDTRGVYIYHADENKIENIWISSCTDDGFAIARSKHNTITNITTNNNGDYGFYLGYSADLNEITNSTANSNNRGFYFADDANNNTLRNCIANSNTGYGGFVMGTMGGGSHNNTFINCTANFNDGLSYSAGFFFWGADIGSDSNIILNSTANSNSYGFEFSDDSDYNIIKNSVAENNTNGGIFLDSNFGDPEYNKIYNCLFNNSGTYGNVRIDSIIPNPNYWNTTKQTGTRIYSSGNYIGGNYWTNSTDNGYSDTCPDTDNNGFCDQVYDVYNDTWCEPGVNCSSNVDYLPLSDEWMLPD